MEKSYGQVLEEEAREQRRKTIQEAADEFLVEYKAKHEAKYRQTLMEGSILQIEN